MRARFTPTPAATFGPLPKSVFGAAWSPDGKQIVFTSDIAGRSNLWKVSASGGWPIQLTQPDERQYNAAWSPDGKWIVYQQDHAGDELWDLYAVPSDGGEINIVSTGFGPVMTYVEALRVTV